MNIVFRWFVLGEVVSSYPEHEVKVKIGVTAPDREVADKVELAIIVVDDATEVNGNSSAGKSKLCLVLD